MTSEDMDHSTLHILHVDMDAFFAAVEVFDQPDLKGKPIIIGSPPNQRGVVSTASYEARRYGVHSAMPSRTAGKKCPEGIFLPPRMARYKEISSAVMTIFHQYTPDVEPISIDEAFLDVSGVLWLWKSAETLAHKIQDHIQAELHLSASIGVAPNKFLAKLSSDLKKPGGLTVAPTAPDDIAAFLAPLPVERIWGVGAKTLEQLHGIGIRQVSDLQRSNPDILASTVGKRHATHLMKLALGQDDRHVEGPSNAKSISGETTFDENTSDPDKIRAALMSQVERVGPQLRKANVNAGTAQMKIRFAPFDTLTRQLPLNPPSRHDHDLMRAANQLLDAVPLQHPVRLIGFGVTGLTDRAVAQQGDLFTPPGSAEKKERSAKLDEAVDSLRATYGRHKIRHGSSMSPPPDDRDHTEG